jgi:uncharacterized small protein (DUF1192 family)
MNDKPLPNKRIAFLVVSTAPDLTETILYASWDEDDRNNEFQAIVRDKSNLGVIEVQERIVNVSQETQWAKDSLNGLHKLLLGI